jgi:2-keto-4-pentenoate hydratase/2-oxohepta-3-ene-1,7-dioic acid hydratase in catechol pathway
VDIPAVWYDRPVYYKGNCFSVVGTGAEVHWPKRSRIVDFELEVALVTGRQGKDITENDALDHVFGYMVFNDFSARDLQYEEIHGSLGPAKGKDFDTGNAMGPWLVTADEVGDPQQLDMAVRVNGELWGSGNSSEMHHGFRRLVSYASQDETLYPGEVLGSGTLGGGCGNERGRFLQHDDVVEMTVQGLGTLRNRIVAPHIPQPPALPIAIFPASAQPAAA